MATMVAGMDIYDSANGAHTTSSKAAGPRTKQKSFNVGGLFKPRHDVCRISTRRASAGHDITFVILDRVSSTSFPIHGMSPQTTSNRALQRSELLSSQMSESEAYIPPSGVAEDGWTKVLLPLAARWLKIDIVEGWQSNSDLLLRRGAALVRTYIMQWVSFGITDTPQPVDGDDLVDTFICHCYDCRKVTASMYASNFIVKDGAIKWIRGEDKLSEWGQSKTIATGNKMTNRFCSVCGTLMARVSSGFPGMSILRIGTVDDFRLHETKLKPRIEQFAKDRVAWCAAGDGVTQKDGNYYTG